MGQYYKVVNLRDKQYLHPHDTGDGLKLMEFGMSGYGLLSVLAAAIANTREHKGSWAGANLVVAGDYADNERFVPENTPNVQEINLYAYIEDESSGYVNVSRAYAELTEHALGVEVRDRMAWRQTPEKCPRVLSRLAERKKVSSLEELFDLFDEVLEPQSASGTAENLLRGFRVGDVASTMAWHRAQAIWVMHPEGDIHLRFTLEANHNATQHAGEVVDLVFPMTATQLAKKLGFLEQWRKHFPRAMSAKTAAKVAAKAEKALGHAPKVARPDLAI